MRILFDTNVVLDVLLARQPHVFAAAELFELVNHGTIDGLLCATTVTTIHYLSAKVVGRNKADKLIRDLLTKFKIAAVDHAVLTRAFTLGFRDYEDAVLHESAQASEAMGIVTRNQDDFRAARLSVFDPSDLLAIARKAK